MLSRFFDLTPAFFEESQQYLAKAKEWIDEHQRICLQLSAEAQPTPTPTAETQWLPTTDEMGDIDTGELRRSLTTDIEFADQSRLSLALRMQELGDRLDRLRADHDLQVYTTLRDSVDEKIEQRFAAMKMSTSVIEEGECTPNPTPPLPDAIAALRKVEATVSGEVQEVATTTASIVTDLRQCDDALKQMKAEAESMKQSISVVRSSFFEALES